MVSEKGNYKRGAKHPAYREVFLIYHNTKRIRMDAV